MSRYVANSYDYEEERARKINGKHEKYLAMARRMAMNSDMRQKHGCIVVCKGEVISYGWNRFANAEMSCTDSFHAEVDAVCRLRKSKTKFPVSDCELYIVRIGREDMGCPLKNSKPCSNCRKVICNAGIGKIYFSSELTEL